MYREHELVKRFMSNIYVDFIFNQVISLVLYPKSSDNLKVSSLEKILYMNESQQKKKHGCYLSSECRLKLADRKLIPYKSKSWWFQHSFIFPSISPLKISAHGHVLYVYNILYILNSVHSLVTEGGNDNQRINLFKVSLNLSHKLKINGN